MARSGCVASHTDGIVFGKSAGASMTTLTSPRCRSKSSVAAACLPSNHVGIRKPRPAASLQLALTLFDVHQILRVIRHPRRELKMHGKELARALERLDPFPG